MALQSQVFTTKAAAVAGDIAVPENAQFYPVNLLADSAGVEVGKFVYTASGVATGTASGAPLGVAVRNLSYPNYTVTSGGSLLIPEGEPVNIMANGDVYVTATDSAVVGASVYVNASGAIVTTSASGATDTGWKVAAGGTSGATILICKH